MNLKLKRTEYRADGIFSDCFDDMGQTFMRTLEHAYGDDTTGYLPKVPPGIYTCKRSMHRLHGMDHDFETFEIEGVEGHDNILFHWGNYNRDSEGCVLVGDTEAVVDNGVHIVTGSRKKFAAFMALQDGVDEFQLEVIA
jgi:hypothetical protein